MANDLRLEISDFRAIGNADIILDGITVIAGENGSGKSTISKLLYHTFKVSKDFDIIIIEQLKRKLQPVSSNLKSLMKEYSFLLNEKEEQVQRVNEIFYHSLSEMSDNDFSLELYITAIDESTELIKSIIDDINNSDFVTRMMTMYNFRKGENHAERIRKILIDCLPINLRSDVESAELDGIIDYLKNYIKGIYEINAQLIEKRSVVELDNKLDRVFEKNSLKDNFKLYEHGIEVIDREYDRLMILNLVNETVYIDTPMSIGLPNTGKNYHWDDLNKLLMVESTSVHFDELYHILPDQVMHGNVYFEKKDVYRNRFTFQRNDGTEFNLLECATGVKSFAILQMLLKNGVLNEKTFLIIDEPEVHLHPQWIVEYARFLVVLNREFGVKMLVASHSPDMVSALKYITEKEGKPENLNFYIAEPISGSYQYNYKHLGIEIEDIFSSYNKSYDKLNDYTA